MNRACRFLPGDLPTGSSARRSPACGLQRGTGVTRRRAVSYRALPRFLGVRPARDGELAVRLPAVQTVHPGTVWLCRSGSPESKKVEEAGPKWTRRRGSGSTPPGSRRAGLARAGAAVRSMRTRSVLAMGAILFGTWFAQSLTSWTRLQHRQPEHGEAAVRWLSFLGCLDFWQPDPAELAVRVPRGGLDGGVASTCGSGDQRSPSPWAPRTTRRALQASWLDSAVVVGNEPEHEGLREPPVAGVERNGDAVVVTLAGELDLYNAEAVRNVLIEECARKPERVIIDLSRVEFIDSTALGVLIEARTKLENGLHLPARLARWSRRGARSRSPGSPPLRHARHARRGAQREALAASLATIASAAAAASTPIARSRTSPSPRPATPSSSAATPAEATTIPTENGQTRRAGGSTRCRRARRQRATPQRRTADSCRPRRGRAARPRTRRARSSARAGPAGPTGPRARPRARRQPLLPQRRAGPGARPPEAPRTHPPLRGAEALPPRQRPLRVAPECLHLLECAARASPPQSTPRHGMPARS